MIAAGSGGHVSAHDNQQPKIEVQPQQPRQAIELRHPERSEKRCSGDSLTRITSSRFNAAMNSELEVVAKLKGSRRRFDAERSRQWCIERASRPDRRTCKESRESNWNNWNNWELSSTQDSGLRALEHRIEPEFIN
jgi:hypothetical protein